MILKNLSSVYPPTSLPESWTGIRWLNEIIGGGLPAGRPMLSCGRAGYAWKMRVARNNDACPAVEIIGLKSGLDAGGRIRKSNQQ